MSDQNFHQRSEHELSRLSDEQLLAYVRKAREAGQTDAMTIGVRLLVWGYLRLVEYRVALKVPPHQVDEVVAEVIESAMKAAFDGSDEAGGKELPQAPDEGTVDVQRAIDAAVDELGDSHRQVVDLYVFADLTAGDVAAKTGEIEANVH